MPDVSESLSSRVACVVWCRGSEEGPAGQRGRGGGGRDGHGVAWAGGELASLSPSLSHRFESWRRRGDPAVSLPICHCVPRVAPAMPALAQEHPTGSLAQTLVPSAASAAGGAGGLSEALPFGNRPIPESVRLGFSIPATCISARSPALLPPRALPVCCPPAACPRLHPCRPPQSRPHALQHPRALLTQLSSDV